MVDTMKQQVTEQARAAAVTRSLTHGYGSQRMLPIHKNLQAMVARLKKKTKKTSATRG
jgi:hypothetical protein